MYWYIRRIIWDRILLNFLGTYGFIMFSERNVLAADAGGGFLENTRAKYFAVQEQTADLATSKVILHCEGHQTVSIFL